MKEITNDKGFKVLEVSRVDLVNRLADRGCLGICDNCTRSPEVGYYIAVLNQWFCKKCYEEWLKTAVNYPEDRWIENIRYENYKDLLK